jgi:hypothetical protein
MVVRMGRGLYDGQAEEFQPRRRKMRSIDLKHLLMAKMEEKWWTDLHPVLLSIDGDVNESSSCLLIRTSHRTSSGMGNSTVQVVPFRTYT